MIRTGKENWIRDNVISMSENSYSNLEIETSYLDSITCSMSLPSIYRAVTVSLLYIARQNI